MTGQSPIRPGGKPTLRTIAQLSGLAVATVSRALNDAPDIGAETKTLVRRIAREVGYVPDRAGLRLRTGRTNVISLVLPAESDMLTNTGKLIAGVAGALRGTPYHLIITPFFVDQDPMTPVRYVVETGSADALIINQTQPDDPRVAWLLERGFPFATHGRTAMAERHPWFDYDNEAFARIGLRRLARRGCRKVVLMAPPHGQSYAGHMIAGARAEAEEQGVALLIEDKVDTGSPGEILQAAVEARLADTPGIDGYLCASTTSAMWTVAGIEASGRQLGQDMQLFTKEAGRVLGLFRRDILSVHEDVGRAGDFLARAAMRAIREPGLAPMQMLDVPRGEGR